MKLGKEPNQRLRYIADAITFYHLGYVFSEDFTSEFMEYIKFCK